MSEKVKIIDMENKDDMVSVNEESNTDILKPDEEDDEKEEVKDEKKEEKKEDVPEVEEKESIEMILSKTSIINKINLWKIGFPEVLKHIPVDKEASYDELIATEKICSFTVSTANCGSAVSSGVSTVAGVMEVSAPYVGMNLAGYQNTLMSNPQFNNTLKEISIKYSDYFYTDPITRLTMSMFQTAAMVHMINQQKALNNIKEKMAGSNIDEELKDKYKDLKN